MPILPILGIHIFSDSYGITEFSGVQKVTNVVKKYVKKWSIGRKKGFSHRVPGFNVQRSEVQYPIKPLNL
jgi:hypothetical protein